VSNSGSRARAGPGRPSRPTVWRLAMASRRRPMRRSSSRPFSQAAPFGLGSDMDR
jgi:hypothetical protein